MHISVSTSILTVVFYMVTNNIYTMTVATFTSSNITCNHRHIQTGLAMFTHSDSNIQQRYVAHLHHSSGSILKTAITKITNSNDSVNNLYTIAVATFTHSDSSN